MFWQLTSRITGSFDTAMSVAPAFGIAKASEARAIAREVGAAVLKWQTVAKSCGLSRNAIARMESAFEHYDLRAVEKLV